MYIIEASKARKPIKKMLLGGGGSAQVHHGDTSRMLSHTFLDGPVQRLPWPLNLLQPHNVRYLVMKRNDIVYEQKFKKRQIDEAINMLLEGLEDNVDILILPNDSNTIVNVY